MAGDKTFKADFFVVIKDGKRGSVFKGVFGRCRFGETPEQGTETGQEKDVVLTPGYGLVEKNHFLFYTDLNLLVWQRNSSGSHYTRLQRYLNEPDSRGLQLEPVLTRDSYKRLMQGGEVKVVDFSFQHPKDPELLKGEFLHDAVKLIKKVGGTNARIRVSVGRSQNRLRDIKDAAIALANAGLAKVARVQLDDSAEPVDLIADRVIQAFTVALQKNGRPDPSDIFAGLDQAKRDRVHDLRAFFG